MCPGLRLKSLRWATPVKSLRRPGSHNRPGQQTYPRSKLQRVYIICKTVTPWLHSGPTVPSAACRRGLVFPTSRIGLHLVGERELIFRTPPGNVLSMSPARRTNRGQTGHWVLTIPIAEATSLNRLDRRSVYLKSGPSCRGGRSGKS